MRTIYLLRGAPASGKSTWIKENNLEPYTICPDNIRLMMQSPTYSPTGEKHISQKNDKQVWELVFQLLEQRMEKGEFIVIDATHYKSTLLTRYTEFISKYRYRAYIVDFTDIPKEELHRRNELRTEYKKVPAETINKMSAVFEVDTEVSKRFKILTRKEASDKLSESLLYNFDNYKKIVIIGDIHGCYDPIEKYFNTGLNDDTLYIFIGDYIDRGIQNDKVINFLLSIKDKKNVILLEGNHERWLKLYSNKDYKEEDICSEEFLTKTVPQLAGIAKKDLRQLCRKFAQMCYFEFNQKKYFISHGGISIQPNIFIATNELIKGFGRYEDTDVLYKHWLSNTPEDHILIHGHRNIFFLPTKINDRIYNLCDEVEYGKPLRILEIDKEEIKVIEIPNNIFDLSTKKHSKRIVEQFYGISSDDIINSLNADKNIIKKILPNDVISYNFSRDAFKKSKWNTRTLKARALFVNRITSKIIARGYNKFFGW